MFLSWAERPAGRLSLQRNGFGLGMATSIRRILGRRSHWRDSQSILFRWPLPRHGRQRTNQLESYGFATVKSDKDDDASGEIVTITGSGWQPEEMVTLVLKEDPRSAGRAL